MNIFVLQYEKTRWGNCYEHGKTGRNQGIAAGARRSKAQGFGAAFSGLFKYDIAPGFEIPGG